MLINLQYIFTLFQLFNIFSIKLDKKKKKKEKALLVRYHYHYEIWLFNRSKSKLFNETNEIFCNGKTDTNFYLKETKRNRNHLFFLTEFHFNATNIKLSLMNYS